MGTALNNKILSASKCSALTEVIAKLVTPISTMVLARLLTPEAFGILVTATMVISFAEIFTDAGFQKYLIQHDFDSDDDKYQATTVAFWCNFILSLAIWIAIVCFSNPIASLVGCSGYGLVIIVVSICIPLGAFSSIQMALYKRHLDFKTLFVVRIIGICIPLIFTIPIAFLTRSYWSLVLGMILLNFVNAIVLTVKSPWKPKLFFNFSVLKKMFSFSVWTVVESLSIWFTSYIDIFLVGAVLGQYYLGVYRTSMTLVSQITSVIVNATTPVLFSSLSRNQNDKDSFRKIFFDFQKVVGLALFPLAIFIYLFKDIIVDILLGNEWRDAAYFIGIWGLSSAVVIVFSHYSSEVYRALGKPRCSFLAQVLHLLFLVPIIFLFVEKDFNTFCFARTVARYQVVLVNIVLLYIVVKISPICIFKNLWPILLSSGNMLLVAYLFKFLLHFNTVLLMPVVLIAYFATMMSFSDGRKGILQIKQLLKKS